MSVKVHITTMCTIGLVAAVLGLLGIATYEPGYGDAPTPAFAWAAVYVGSGLLILGWALHIITEAIKGNDE